jgi:hypothetical protein
MWVALRRAFGLVGLVGSSVYRGFGDASGVFSASAPTSEESSMERIEGMERLERLQSFPGEKSVVGVLLGR